MRWFLALLLGIRLCGAAGPAADLARSIRETSLDPEECYRVRELTLVKEDVRFYFTDGYLIFGKPVGGVRVTSAVFTVDTESGDAEVLVLPPNRGERRSLASYTGSPNLDEHFTAVVMVFSDDTHRVLVEQTRQNPFNRKSPEMGVLLSEKWTAVARNISTSFESRLVLDLLSGETGVRGFFAATLSGKQLGNFDVSYDPRAQEQVLVGQLTSRENHTFFDVWSSFAARSSRNPARARDFDVALDDYRIEATLEPDLRLRVVTKVKAKSMGEPQQVLPFEIARAMVVSSALVDGRPAEVLQRESMRSNLIRNSGNDLFLVAPPAPLQPGREHELEIRSEGKVIHDAGNQVYYVGARSNWYPHYGLQYAKYDLTFRYPRELDLVTPGDVVEDRTEGEWRVTRRRTASSIRLAGFNLGRYELARVTRGGYSVEVCANHAVERALQPRMPQPLLVPPPTWSRQRRQEVPTLPPAPMPPKPALRLHELASEIASALEFMSGRFGPPALPSLTVSPVPGAFGQGLPGLIYLSTLAYLERQEKPVAALNQRDQVFFSEILQAHETAHQWWGNVVASAGYHDDWLMEALANYSALLYLEKRKGLRSLETALGDYKTSLLARTESGQTVDATGPIVLGARLESSQAPQAWRSITYGKGSWIIHMLRRRMGDQQFLAMLAELRRRYERKAITTDQFRLMAAEFLPPKSPDPKLESFFDQWVYGTGIPALKLSYSLKGKAPALRLAGKVTQSDVDDEFSVRVPIEIQFGRGKAITHWVRTGSDLGTFTVALRQAPVKVLLDPGFSVLRK